MDDPVERLKDGFHKFKTEVYDKKPELFEPLKAGQAPKVCATSLYYQSTMRAAFSSSR
ncbi:carbonic anhydrase3 [Zea mays]|uniref:Carbonic anhydrase3 n=1 Tax=Zea mays TaxID=4577 RepID=A0A1D6NHQ6_MAIZE|nr:carbonic anhydrase3 [Zea mays]